MARGPSSAIATGFTLEQIAGFVPDTLTDEVLRRRAANLTQAAPRDTVSA